MKYSPKTHKRCQATQKDGCGEYKPYSQFPSCMRRRGTQGLLKKYYGSWCCDCQKKRDRARREAEKVRRRTGGKAGGSALNRPEHRHTGPREGTPEHAFFCK